jgi:hypothetical protein
MPSFSGCKKLFSPQVFARPEPVDGSREAAAQAPVFRELYGPVMLHHDGQMLPS